MKAVQYIIVEGAIGVGKTSLTTSLSQKFSAKNFLEIVEDNPFLVNEFYQNMSSAAFNTEIFFLLARFRQQRQIKKQLLSTSELIISDYLFQKNSLFASLTLSREDFQIFSTVYEPLLKQVPTPDLVIHLKADVETLMNRIRMRDRQFERIIEEKYLVNLLKKYEEFFKTYNDAPVLTIQVSDLDFVHEAKDYEKILRKIMEHTGELPLVAHQQSLSL